MRVLSVDPWGPLGPGFIAVPGFSPQGTKTVSNMKTSWKLWGGGICHNMNIEMKATTSDLYLRYETIIASSSDRNRIERACSTWPHPFPRCLRIGQAPESAYHQRPAFVALGSMGAKWKSKRPLSKWIGHTLGTVSILYLRDHGM